VRTHFDRVVLALDFAAPHEVGPALDGLEAAGWWCPDESASILSSALAERIGIPLRNIRLSMSKDLMHEVHGQRRSAIAADPALPDAPVSRLDHAHADRVPEPPAEPEIVDCDLQVRERLRFLVWMRGVQAEGHRELEAQH